MSCYQVNWDSTQENMTHTVTNFNQYLNLIKIFYPFGEEDMVQHIPPEWLQGLAW